MNAELEKYLLIAQRLGFRVEFSHNLSWNHGKVSFYPCRKIIIGTRNYDSKTANYCGIGEISERVQALILKHEIGHILVYQSKYPDMDLAEYCLSNDTHFKIINEIYAWKTVLDDESLTVEDLEFIQEQINEYVWCELIGTCTIEPQCELSQKLIDGLKSE